VQGGQSALSGLAAQLIAVSANTVVQQCNADTALAEQNLQYAFQLLQAQFAGNYNLTSSSFAAGAQTAIGSPIGNPIINVSVLRGDGLSLEYGYAETLTFRCTQDKFSGATINNEAINVLGQAAATDPWLWPDGSGTNVTLNVIDATADYPSGGNLLVNSDMEVVSNSNIADNWIVLTGTRGTQIFAGNTNPYTGSNAMWFTGSGGVATAIYQAFNTTPSTTLGSGGTAYELEQRTMYAFNAQVMVDSTPAAGVLAFSLVDDTDAVLNDDAGNANTISIDLTTVTSAYQSVKGYFRTPTNLPDVVRLRVKTTTAITNTHTVYFDHLSLGLGQSLYGTLPQGPYVVIHSGDTPPRQGDGWTVAMTSNLALTTWQGQLQFQFNIAQIQSVIPGLGIRMPTTGGSTVSSALIA
jgi:hypothetical protein